MLKVRLASPLPYNVPMKFVFASDSFKGTLASARTGVLLETAAREVFPGSECVVFPIADGGEGTLDAIAGMRQGTRLSFPAHDGLMRPIEGQVLLCDGMAFVEAASTCGLSLLDSTERNPLRTTSYGVGECIRFALDTGCAEITVGLGGSCTNDGGMGCLRALGVTFLDSEGCELFGAGGDLASIACFDTSGLHPRVRDVPFTIMGDVNNPLLGPNGATYVFGPQKGADAQALERLEKGMGHFAEAISSMYPDVDFATEGFGAAGGLGMALSVFLGARMRSGIEELLTWLRFDSVIEDADLVVTGEGKLDSQSLQGKVISGIVAHARRAGVPVAVICGRVELAEEELHGIGVTHVLEAGRGQALDYAMAHAEENYLKAARELFTLVKGS